MGKYLETCLVACAEGAAGPAYSMISKCGISKYGQVFFETCKVACAEGAARPKPRRANRAHHLEHLSATNIFAQSSAPQLGLILKLERQ